jgi:cupin superfamily acireductone dioxygenase involved in methionine salvage
MTKINVKDTEVTVISIDERDYISLAKYQINHNSDMKNRKLFIAHRQFRNFIFCNKDE